jgi:predicted thioesterase
VSPQVGTKIEQRAVVDREHAIGFLGPEGAQVLATPAMILYMEMASRDLAKQQLEKGYDTVGTHVDVKHLAATPIGMEVEYRAELIEVNERRLRFRVEAFDEREKIGEGWHERAVVNVAKFSERVRAKAAPTGLR